LPASNLKIGIVGGYISGKATFINALLKTPCFSMRSNTHNHIPIVIQRATNEKVSWEYIASGKRGWTPSRDDIRCSQDHQLIRAKIPCYPWGDTEFYDFPQVNDITTWESEHISLVNQMDFVISIFDAEYVMSLANKRTIDLLASIENKLLAIILNKCDVVDKIGDLADQMEMFFANSEKRYRIFTVSSSLELQRWCSPEKRQTMFAFTESRKGVMMTCDFAFSDLRAWLYENIFLSKYNQITTTET